MPITAEARVLTDRPGRYLTQLCKHFSNKGRHLGHRPRSHSGADHRTPGLDPEQIHVEWSDTHGVLRLPWGTCAMDAEPGALVLRVEADDEEGLRRLQELLAAHIGRFGRREELRVDWQGSGTATPEPERPAPPSSSRRRRLAWVGTAALVAVVVAVHLGLAGALLSAPRWTGWAAVGVVAAVALKVMALTAWGRHLHRRNRRQA
ncbi:DUF2218 domain-containing protein [Streptomyces sp. NPDC050803]|uniref:DUF2218 domain-containing protein n=1 Tax=unclassified Streptomyces TaxID=2593676 RepID=UPI00341905E5